MPLQRFIPSSSDRYISNDKNQGAVKFGHLNAVVDYINENGGGAPAGAIGEVQFNGGGVLAADPGLFWDNTNKRLGVGTNAPAEKFVIQNDNGGAALVVQANSFAYAQVKRYSNNGTRARYETYKSRGTIQSPLSIQTADEIGSVDFHAYDGSAFQRNGIIYVTAQSVSGGLITPVMRFGLGTAGNTNQYRLSIFNDGNVSIGQETNANARLGVRGSGSTSATTSLLVQNSSGQQLLSCRDDGFIGIGTTSGGFICDAGGPDKIRATSVGVGIEGSPVSTASLAVNSTTKGFLPPRMTTTQKTAISAPAAGLIVYDNTLNQMSYYNGSAWVNF